MHLTKEEIFNYFYRENLKPYLVYHRSIDSKPKEAKLIAERLAKYVSHKTKEFRILDVGCGGGELAKSLVVNLTSTLPELPIYLLATDISEKMVELAESRLKNLSGNLKVDFSQIGVQAQCSPRLFDAVGQKRFDFLLCSFVLFYIKDWNDALNQFLGCLNPGGNLCVVLRSRDKGRICVNAFHRLYEIAHEETGYKMEFAEDFEELLHKHSIPFETDFVTCNTNLKTNDSIEVTEPVEFIMRYPKEKLSPHKTKLIEEYLNSTLPSGTLKCFDKLVWVKKQ